MAEDKDKKTFPMLPIGHWWQLRKQFKRSIPGVVTDSYLATVLDMQPNSARANVLPFLKDLGIIDDEGKPTSRANFWRDDGHYAGVCKDMLDGVYPAELREAVPDPNANRPSAERWFANRTGAGEAAVRRMAALYALLVEGDISKQPDEKDKKERPVRKATVPTPPVVRAAVPEPPLARRPFGGQDHELQEPKRQKPPDININLQVHISADSTSDQIDQIFASMAKHIYRRDD